MYYEDRLNGSGIEQVVFASTGTGSSSESLKMAIEQLFNDSSNVVFERLGKRLAGSIKNTTDLALNTLDNLAAPIGILVRDRHD